MKCQVSGSRFRSREAALDSRLLASWRLGGLAAVRDAPEAIAL